MYNNKVLVSPKHQQGRNTNIEILRFVLMCFIFFWHILVHGYNLKMLGADSYQYSGNFGLTGLLLTLFVPATYCFVFISGYYGIRFKVSRLLNLLLWCVIVSVSAKCYNIYKGGSSDVVDFLESLLPITSNKWWFMTDYVMLYILSPIFNEEFDHLRIKSKVYLLGLLFIFSVMGILVLYQNQGSNLVGLIMVYLLARLLRERFWGGIFTMRNSIKIYASSFILLFSSIIAIYYGADLIHLASAKKMIFPLLSYANPLNILMAVSLFYIVKNIPQYSNSLLNKILSANLFIYLITEIGGFVSYQDIAVLFDRSFGLAMLYSFGIIIACLGIGYLIMMLVSMIVKKVLYIVKNNINVEYFR